MVSASEAPKLDLINCLSMEDIQQKILSIYGQIERDGFVIIQGWDASMDYLSTFGDLHPDPNSFKAFGMHHPLSIDTPNKMPRSIPAGIYFQPKQEGVTYV